MARSPSYPALPLRSALDKAEAIYDKLGRSPATETEIVMQWGVGLHGKSRRQLSALRQYELLETASGGDKLSSRAVTLISAPRTSEQWKEALRAVVYAPAIFREIHEKFMPGLPSDGILESYLVGELDFTPDGARRCISTLRDNQSFVKQMAPSEDSPAQVVEVAQEAETADAVDKSNAASTQRNTTRQDEEGIMTFVSPLIDGSAQLRIEGQLDEDELLLLRNWLSHVQLIVASRVRRGRSKDAADGSAEKVQREIAAELRTQADELDGDE